MITELKRHYDFIVCGSASSGAVVAARLAQKPEVNVLLIEAGGSDDWPAVQQAASGRKTLAASATGHFARSPIPI